VATNNSDGKSDLPERLRQWLALFQSQQPCELVLPRFQRVSQLSQQGTALADRFGRPGGEHRLGRGNCLVKLRSISSWRLGQHFLVARINHIKLGGAGYQLAVDQ
jgi:hypothetical protein